MTRVHEASRSDLEKRRARVLDRVGLSYEELAAKAKSYSLVADEWSAWEEVREIDFLLDG